MTQNILTADVVATRFLDLLENNLVMARKVYRDYEGEYSKNVNGFKKGAKIRIKKPIDFVVREGNVAQIQEIVEGHTDLTVDTPLGIDFELSSTELTLDIENEDLNERVFKPAMVQLANKVDTVMLSLYKDVWNWVGTPGQTVKNYVQFAKAPERLDSGAVMTDNRTAVLSPASHWGLLGSQTGLYIQDAAKGAYREGSLGKIGGVDTFMSQNVQSHVPGTGADASAVADAAAGNGVLSTTYDTVKDTGVMYLSTDGWDTGTLKHGDVFTLANIKAVNPVSKAVLDYDQQFVVKEDKTLAGTSNDDAILISPPIITSGAYQTVGSAPVDGTTAVVRYHESGTVEQNLVFHKNAFALAIVPMEMPQDGTKAARKTYKGISLKVTPGYDWINDINRWRVDLLLGKKTLDARLATRLSGASL